MRNQRRSKQNSGKSASYSREYAIHYAPSAAKMSWIYTRKGGGRALGQQQPQQDSWNLLSVMLNELLKYPWRTPRQIDYNKSENRNSDLYNNINMH